MSEAEKLQKAVELTLAAGYQLNKEAFEFLNIIMATEDPAEVMSKAIKQLEELGERPFFIERNFLEQMMEAEKPTKEIISEPSQNRSQPQTGQQTPQITEDKMPFHPYAKDVDASINIIDDPSTKLSSSGTIEDFLEYFQDRFRQTEKLLRQRMDVKSAASVMDALRAQSGTRLKIIGMITEKRESKQKIILTVEDLTASMAVLVPQDASSDLQKKARFLMLDQIVCLGVVKTRSNLLIAEDIILPDVPQKTPHKAPVTSLRSTHLRHARWQHEIHARSL